MPAAPQHASGRGARRARAGDRARGACAEPPRRPDRGPDGRGRRNRRAAGSARAEPRSHRVEELEHVAHAARERCAVLPEPVRELAQRRTAARRSHDHRVELRELAAEDLDVRAGEHRRPLEIPRMRVQRAAAALRRRHDDVVARAREHEPRGVVHAPKNSGITQPSKSATRPRRGSSAGVKAGMRRRSAAAGMRGSSAALSASRFGSTRCTRRSRPIRWTRAQQSHEQPEPSAPRHDLAQHEALDPAREPALRLLQSHDRPRLLEDLAVANARRTRRLARSAAETEKGLLGEQRRIVEPALRVRPA